jgi:gas vesicle protein
MQAFIWIASKASKLNIMRPFACNLEINALVSNQEGENKMVHEDQEYEHPSNNTLSLLVGMLVGSLVGVVTMLLLAPQSGKDSRMHIRKKGLELRDRTTQMKEDTMAQVRSSVNKIASAGRERIKELKQPDRALTLERLDGPSAAVDPEKI